MKRLIICIVVLVSFLFFTTSCESFLNEELTTKPTEKYYKTADGFQAGVNAIYRYLRPLYPGGEDRWGNTSEATATLLSSGTDLFTHGSDGRYKGLQEYDKTLNATRDLFRYYWEISYKAINQANAMIALAQGDVAGVPNAIETERSAEAHFLRALFYFHLVRMFGPVTLTLKPTTEVSVKATRSPMKEIYNKVIIPDLKFAINNLPATQDDYGRATKPAAQMLLSKVLLTRGYTDFAQPNDFSSAATLAEAVIHDYDFKLLDNYAAVFDINNQRNKEIIFAVQYTHDNLLNGGGNSAHLWYLMEYDVLPGMKRDIQNGRPWKRFMPTEFLLGLWNREIDVRWDASFLRVFYANNPSTIPTNSSGEPYFSVGDTAVYLPGHEVPQAFEESKHYMIIEPDEYTRKLYPTLTKHLDPTRATVNQAAGTRDFFVWRLADTYLTAAEAYFQMGKMSKAAQAINKVRLRAAKPGKEDKIRITPSQVTLEFILDERGRELAGEMHRWYVLKRTDKLIGRIRKYNSDAAPRIQSFHKRRPIPQSQIDRVTKGNYEQNSGY